MKLSEYKISVIRMACHDERHFAVMHDLYGKAARRPFRLRMNDIGFPLFQLLDQGIVKRKAGAHFLIIKCRE